MKWETNDESKWTKSSPKWNANLGNYRRFVCILCIVWFFLFVWKSDRMLTTLNEWTFDAFVTAKNKWSMNSFDLKPFEYSKENVKWKPFLWWRWFFFVCDVHVTLKRASKPVEMSSTDVSRFENKWTHWCALSKKTSSHKNVKVAHRTFIGFNIYYGCKRTQHKTDENRVLASAQWARR